MHPLVELRLRRQLAVDQQVGDLEVGRLLRELLDRIAAVLEDALVAVDVGDRRPARRRVRERRVVGHEPEVVLGDLDLAQVHGAHGAVLDRDLVGLAGAVVGDGQRVAGGGYAAAVRGLFLSSHEPIMRSATEQGAPRELLGREPRRLAVDEDRDQAGGDAEREAIGERVGERLDASRARAAAWDARGFQGAARRTRSTRRREHRLAGDDRAGHREQRSAPTLIAITPRAALLVGGKVSCARIPIAETTTAQTASSAAADVEERLRGSSLGLLGGERDQGVQHGAERYRTVGRAADW